jgi:peptidoglycan pentaglycine glycine transferase (the first glycine)
VNVRILTSANDLAAYDTWVKSHPQGSLWQSLEWKTYQESMGREVRIYGCEDVGSELRETAMIIIDRTSFGLSTWDCPRGPLEEIRDQRSEISKLIEKIVQDAAQDRCLSIYLSPIEKLEAKSYQLKASSRHEQPEATRILDLSLSDEKLLAQMHQKGRYNINVARKNGVRIEQSQDIDAYYALAQKTGKRDAFGIPSKRQLKTFLENLDGSFLLLAYAATSNSKLEAVHPAIAGLLGVTWNNTGIYYYGASDYEHRNLMAPYLLQWEAIQHCKRAGCATYDLLGIAPAGSDETHPWAGISGFKEKFGGTVISYPTEQEITLKPMVKQLLKMKRKLIG